MKIDRLISIILWMNGRGRVTAKSLAEKYEVSVKTIQRDIDAIDRAGVPIVSFKGQDGGYEIEKNYRIDRSVLKRQDGHLIAKLLEGLGRTYNFRELDYLKEKFSVFDGENSMQSRFLIDFSSWGDEAKTREKLRRVDLAFHERRTLVFSYHNLYGERSRRIVEPLKLVFKYYNWYLCAFCRGKEAPRLFKVRRMSEIEMGESFCAERQIDLGALFQERTDRLTKIKLKISEDLKMKIDDYFESYTMLDADTVEVELPMDDWLFRLILGFGADAEALAPESLRDRIKREIKAMAGIYT